MLIEEILNDAGIVAYSHPNADARRSISETNTTIEIREPGIFSEIVTEALGQVNPPVALVSSTGTVMILANAATGRIVVCKPTEANDRHDRAVSLLSNWYGAPGAKNLSRREFEDLDPEPIEKPEPEVEALSEESEGDRAALLANKEESPKPKRTAKQRKEGESIEKIQKGRRKKAGS